MTDFEFYSNVSSYYGHKAQLALHIKGIDYKFHNLDLLQFEHLEPWYVKMNPGGVVPTLKHGYNVIPESDEIIKYLDVHFTPRLQPNPHSEQGQRCQYYMDKLGKVPIGTLTTGAVLNDHLTVDCQIPLSVRRKISEQAKSDIRVKMINKMLVENPDLVGVYQSKLTEVQQVKPTTYSSDNMEIIIARCGALLQDVEDQLEKVESVYGGEAKWLVGENICTADLSVTAFLFRLKIVGLSKVLFDPSLPLVSKYFQNTQINMPGFNRVCMNFQHTDKDF